MLEKKWTLDVGSNQYDLVSGKFYLVGCWKNEKIQNCVDIPLKSESVDTKHCILDVSDNNIYIFDLYSAFGTFVNNKRLNPMRKECINVNCELRFGELNGSIKAVDILNSTDPFLAPTQRAPRASLSNTSTRLFSSPDVSLLSDTRNESFDIPETQNIKERASLENLSISSSSRNESYDGKSFCDESFIPETQMPFRPEPPCEGSEKSGDFIRICTQDFNENLFEVGDEDEVMFSSLVIPNIQHKPVILTDSTLNMDKGEDVSKTGKCDAEMEALNWGAQTSKNGTLGDTAHDAICTEREDVCTPDLFDLPNLAHITVQPDTNRLNAENILNNNNFEEGQVQQVIGGDGYAEEVDMMATQVFVPISKQPEAGDVISLSGKENIANSDFSLEQTQIFVPVKERNLVEKNINSTTSGKSTTPSVENTDDSSDLLAPTQLFTRNFESNNKSIKSVVKQKFHNTLSSSEMEAKTQNDGNFSDDRNSSKKESEREKQTFFKKPKLSNKNKAIKVSTPSTCSSQSEAEEAILCTPKWITDKFELLSEQHSKISINKCNLFGSDSEEDSIELNKLDAKKDSKDFDKLLCNVKDTQPVKFVKSKCPVLKQGNLTDVRKVDAHKNNQSGREEVVLENPVKKLEGISSEKREEKTPLSTKNSSKKSKTDTKVESHSVNRSNRNSNIDHNQDVEKSEERKKRTKMIPPKDEHTNGKEKASSRRMTRHMDHIQVEEKSAKHKKPIKTVSPKGETTNEIEEVPTRRITRLASRISDMEYDKPSASTSESSQTKLRKSEHIDEPAISKKRVTRSYSKNDSQESISSIKSTSSSQSASKKKNSREVEAQGSARIKSDGNGKTAVKVSNCAKAIEKNDTELTSSRKDNRKRSAEEPSGDECKKLRSNARILQVAMTMVEPKLFQSLVENSPGNWCVAIDPTEADVLVMDKGNRTLKFLIAMAKGIPIVTSKWLQTFNSTKTVPRGITHFFRDHDFEKRHKFSLFKSLELARSHKVFEGYDFVTTPSILPRPSEIKQIIECAGGKVYDEPPSPKKDQKIYVISSMDDKKYWHKYRRCNSNVHITNSEGVMASVMRQSPSPLDLNVFA